MSARHAQTLRRMPGPHARRSPVVALEPAARAEIGFWSGQRGPCISSRAASTIQFGRAPSPPALAAAALPRRWPCRYAPPIAGERSPGFGCLHLRVILLFLGAQRSHLNGEHRHLSTGSNASCRARWQEAAGSRPHGRTLSDYRLTRGRDALPIRPSLTETRDPPQATCCRTRMWCGSIFHSS
jgi:hypothetical protein